MDLFALLLDQSRSVASLMAEGRVHGVEQHEETITETLLLAVARSHPDIEVRTYSKFEERRSGADWVWWWEGRRHWFGAVVQAKRLIEIRPRGWGYDFEYRPRPSADDPHPQRQIDLLFEEGRRNALPAVYALYNGPDFDIRPEAWRCDGIPYEREAMGVAILPAPVANGLIAFDPSLDDVNPFARPLPCHICPGHCGLYDLLPWMAGPSGVREVLGFDEATGDDDLALLSATSLLASLTMWRIGQFRQLPRARPLVRYVRQGVRPEPPEYVWYALEAADEERPFDADPEGPVPSRVIVVRRGR